MVKLEVDSTVAVPNSTIRPRKALKTLYSPESLEIARVMLLAHGSGFPVKRRDLMDIFAGKRIDSTGFEQFRSEASRFLEERMGLKIIELETVAVNNEKHSAKRNEYALISCFSQPRNRFYKVVDSFELRDWGIIAFLTILFVLRDEPASFIFIENALKRANLYEDDSEFFGGLRGTVNSLCSRRILEKIPGKDEFVLGSYAKFLITKDRLLNLILKIQFPNEALDSSEFSKKYEVTLRTLKQRIEQVFS